MVRTNCGDWGQGWGFGGKNKIGKLSTEDFCTFTWEGHSQGRHGNTWNKGAKLVFKLNQGKIDASEQIGGVPNVQALMEGIEELKRLSARQAQDKIDRDKRKANAVLKTIAEAKAEELNKQQTKLF